MEELSESARKILGLLPKDGSMVGNISLRHKLHMDDSEFLQAKQQLKQQGFVSIGSGRGGSLSLVAGNNSPIQTATQVNQPATHDVQPITQTIAPQNANPTKIQISEYAKRILEALPKDGSMVGNISLRSRIQLDASEFIQAKLRLQEQGKIVVGKGKGGSVGLVEISSPIIKPGSVKGVKSESELYPPIKKYFDEEWKPGYTAPDYYCSVITATPKGHKRGSGLWSRPDLAILTVSGYQFLPTKLVEVTTLEAKRYSDATPQAVFETASHSKFAHQAYLIIEWIEETNMDDTDDENVKRILKEAQRFGIGIIQMKNNRGNWEFRDMLDPQRREPEPDDCNTFIEQNFKSFHMQILGALGRR